MKKITFLFTAALLFTASAISFAQQNARVQIIHNSADVGLETVDVYISGLLARNDVEFRTATPFTDVIAGIPLTVKVAPGNSTSDADAFHTTNITLEAGKTYIAVASGTRTAEGYSPFKEFDVEILSVAREEAEDDSQIDILLFQGSTDLPIVNAFEPGVGPIANSIPYGQFMGYLSREIEDYEISLSNSMNGEMIGNYYAEFETLQLQGKAVTILGSGFLDPSVNNNGAEFGLYMATPTGGNLIDMSQQTASVNKNRLTGISIYPNPATSEITMNVPSGSTTVKSVIYDIMGRQVVAGNSTTLNISGLTNGVYILKTDIDGKSFEQKIIKN